jgi:diphthine synthase
MLSLIGLGLWDEKDLTLRGIERAKNADEVYVELYTSKWYGNLKKIEKIIGKKVNVLKRKDLEENSGEIIEEAKDKDLVLFVPGDPLVATTHASLITEAKRRKIKTEIIHNASIYSAIGETGLHVYKFGATATIPFPEKTREVLPVSVYETLVENKRRELHTLLLLDVISEKKKFMTPNEGMKILLKTEETMKKGIFTKNTGIVIFARAGSSDPLIIYGKVKDLLEKDFGDPPFVIIVPGKLHFTEKEYLESFVSE